MSESEGGVGRGNPDSQDTRSQSPTRSFAHRAIMGGAADYPQRSSSPLKRPASDLEQETPLPIIEDVEMDSLPASEPPGMMRNMGEVSVEEDQNKVLKTEEDVAKSSNQPEHQMVTEEHQPRAEGNITTPESERKFAVAGRR
jgi:hypothetical protein